MENKIEPTKLNLDLDIETEIEELESKIAPAGDDSVLPIGLHFTHH